MEFKCLQVQYFRIYCNNTQAEASSYQKLSRMLKTLIVPHGSVQFWICSTTQRSTFERITLGGLGLQGPAILFYDNGGFEERDWKSLQSFYKSEKKHSPSEVGKYGMGSRSFFHIGDVIQIVSGTKFAELDPDERVSSNGRYGARIDFESELFGGKKFSEAYPDECAPFNFFGCTMDTPFDGTIIRAT